MPGSNDSFATKDVHFQPLRSVGRLGRYFTDRAQQNGLIVRGIGDTIALCPPLIINAEEVDLLLARFQRSLGETLQWLQSEGA
ncbi:MAG: aminotransferase [Pseudomonas sp.]|nr:aminotransferase [Pseudomonas sp.]